jgi:hypothetical protein
MPSEQLDNIGPVITVSHGHDDHNEADDKYNTPANLPGS